jgi:hypothetical protein
MKGIIGITNYLNTLLLIMTAPRIAENTTRIARNHGPV